MEKKNEEVFSDKEDEEPKTIISKKVSTRRDLIESIRKVVDAKNMNLKEGEKIKLGNIQRLSKNDLTKLLAELIQNTVKIKIEEKKEEFVQVNITEKKN